MPFCIKVMLIPSCFDSNDILQRISLVGMPPSDTTIDDSSLGSPPVGKGH
jgi:hypothetical protein